MNNADAEMNARASQTCYNCHVGTLQLERATYARWHGKTFIVLPNVQVQRCDFCGETFYDAETLAQLATLLGPEDSLDSRDEQWPDAFGSLGADFNLDDRRRT